MNTEQQKSIIANADGYISELERKQICQLAESFCTESVITTLSRV